MTVVDIFFFSQKLPTPPTTFDGPISMMDGTFFFKLISASNHIQGRRVKSMDWFWTKKKIETVSTFRAAELEIWKRNPSAPFRTDNAIYETSWTTKIRLLSSRFRSAVSTLEIGFSFFFFALLQSYFKEVYSTQSTRTTSTSRWGESFRHGRILVDAHGSRTHLETNEKKAKNGCTHRWIRFHATSNTAKHRRSLHVSFFNTKKKPPPIQSSATPSCHLGHPPLAVQ